MQSWSANTLGLFKTSTILLALLVAACSGGSATKTSSQGQYRSGSATSAPAVEQVLNVPELHVDKSGDWELVWSDEFDGDSLDLSKWEFETNCSGGGNNEQQCYTDREDNLIVRDGMLNIIAKRERFKGNNGFDGKSGYKVSLPYTSARIRTLGKGEWTFGRFEMRARLPQGNGTWPAFWMLPTDSDYGTWASSGEIDILETVNLKAGGTGDNLIFATLHYGRQWPENVQSGNNFAFPDGLNPADGFHTYALEWEEGEIRWYVDDLHYGTQTSDGWYSQYPSKKNSRVLVDGPEHAPYDRNQQYHLILNLAVGGAFPNALNGGIIDKDAFPQQFVVDWVRVYQCAKDNDGSGKGCAARSENYEIVPGNKAPKLNEKGSVSKSVAPNLNEQTDE